MTNEEPTYELDVDQLLVLFLYGIAFYLVGKVLTWW